MQCVWSSSDTRYAWSSSIRCEDYPLVTHLKEVPLTRLHVVRRGPSPQSHHTSPCVGGQRTLETPTALAFLATQPRFTRTSKHLTRNGHTGCLPRKTTGRSRENSMIVAVLHPILNHVPKYHAMKVPAAAVLSNTS